MSTVLERMAAAWLMVVAMAVGTFPPPFPSPSFGGGIAWGAENKPIADHDLAGWMNERIKDWQIKPEERPLDAIGWAKDIREAERLAREHQRAVFLFTHDGRMGIGRC